MVTVNIKYNVYVCGNFVANPPFAPFSRQQHGCVASYRDRHEQPTSAHNPKQEWLSLHQQLSTANSSSNRKLQGSSSTRAGIVV